MRTEVGAGRQAELFWVSRDMVELAVDAAQSLPECYVTTVGRCQ